MDERLVPTRDLFLCQIVALVTFVVAERLGFHAGQMLLGLAIMFVATVASGYVGQRLLKRKLGAVNAYSVALGVGTFIMWFKWWVLG